MCAKSAESHRFSMLEIAAADAPKNPDLIGRILSGEIFGALIRGVFPEQRLADVVRRIEIASNVPMFESHTFRGRTYGRVLRMAGEDLTEYFDAAGRIGAALDEVFGEGPGYEETLRNLLGALGGERPVDVPSVEGRRYAPATVRVIDPGGTVDLHCGNETYAFPPLRELSGIIDVAGEISTLLPLALPEAGGELEVYDLAFGDPLLRELDQSLGRSQAHQGLSDRLALTLRPSVGDLALFAEGVQFHRVNEVRGARPRWTMGGFLAPSRDASTLYYWS